MATAGSATPAGPPGRGDRAEGLKTHISTALSGLLDRALVSQAEQSVTHQTPGPAAVQTSALAREVRRLIMAPTPPRLVLLRAAERAAGKDAPELYPYSCLFCDLGFEREKTRNRHMGHAHKREMYGCTSKWKKSDGDPDGGESSDCGWQEPKASIWTPETPGGDVGADDDFFCSESKPLVTGSPPIECPVESDGRPVTTGAEAACESSGSIDVVTDSVAGTPADSPHSPAGLHYDGQPTGEEAAVTRGAEEPEASESGHGGKARGLKTHISTAFGGLLGRAVSSRLEKTLDPSGPAAVQTSPLRVTKGPTPEQLFLLWAAECAAAKDVPEPYPYSCLYCNCGFKHEKTLNRHTRHSHKREMYGRASKSEEPRDDPDCSEGSDCKLKPPETGSLASEYPTESDGRPVTTCTGAAGGSSAVCAPADSPRVSVRLHCGKRPAGEEAAVTRVAEEPEARNEIPASVSEQLEPEVDLDSEDRDCDGGLPEEVGLHSGTDPEPPLWMFTKRGRPPGRRRLYRPGDEGIRKKAMEALRALGEDGCHFRKRRGRARGKARGQSRRVPARAAELIREKTGSLLSQKRDIEVVFVNEETSFPPDCELPDGHDNAWDPLSIEEETGTFPKAEFSFCDEQSIKKEVLEGPVAVSGFTGCIKVDQELDLDLERADIKVYSNL